MVGTPLYDHGLVGTVVVGGGGGPGISDGFTLKITAAEAASPAPTEATAFALAVATGETNVTPTEAAQLKFPPPDFGDTALVPTDARVILLRYWATGCTTNDTTTGATITPANANGQNDGVFAALKTGTGTADTTNPVTLTTGSLNVPSGLTITHASIIVYFKLASIGIALLDSFSITATASSGYSATVWQGPALATIGYPGVDFSAVPMKFDISALTLAQLQSLVLTASYNSGVVLTPQTTLNIDAWAVELTVTL